MSAADHPKWTRVRNIVFNPHAGIAILTRVAFPLVVMYFTRSGWVLAAAVLGPYLIVGSIDIYLRSRFSLRGLLLAIVTLQIPLAILFTSTSGAGIGLGAALLAIWFFAVAARLEVAMARESGVGGRWNRIEPDDPQ